MEKRIFERFSDFYQKKVNEVEAAKVAPIEKKLGMGDVVQLPSGDIGVIQSWSDQTGEFIVMNRSTGSTEGYSGTELVLAESELQDVNINEDHITQGAKVRLSDGRLGTVEAWEDRIEMYTVSIEGEAKTVKATGDELEVLHTMDGVEREPNYSNVEIDEFIKESVGERIYKQIIEKSDDELLELSNSAFDKHHQAVLNAYSSIDSTEGSNYKVIMKKQEAQSKLQEYIKRLEKISNKRDKQNEMLNEDHITQGSKVRLSDGRLGTVEAWEDRIEMYTVSIEGEAKTVKATSDELEVLHTMDGVVRENNDDFEKAEKIISDAVNKIPLTKRDIMMIVNHDNYETATKVKDMQQILFDALDKKKAKELIKVIDDNNIDYDLALELLQAFE